MNKENEYQEIWKDIGDYKGLYQVSSHGRIKRLQRQTRNKQGNYILKTKILKTGISKDGYCIIGLYKNGKQKIYRVHRLAAKAFIPNPYNYPMINHKDENKRNNHIDNLEWCDAKYNANYGTRNKKIALKNKGHKVTENTREKISKANKGRFNGGKNPASRKIRCIETGQIFDCIRDANVFLGVNRKSSNICRNLKGERKSAFGLHWEYVEVNE